VRLQVGADAGQVPMNLDASMDRHRPPDARTHQKRRRVQGAGRDDTRGPRCAAPRSRRIRVQTSPTTQAAPSRRDMRKRST